MAPYLHTWREAQILQKEVYEKLVNAKPSPDTMGRRNTRIAFAEEVQANVLIVYIPSLKPHVPGNMAAKPA
jgi:hypothetical protein